MLRLTLVTAVALSIGSAFAVPAEVHLYPSPADAVALETAAGFYDSFRFGVLGSCAEPNQLWFHSASTFAGVTLGSDSQGRPVEANLTLQLFDDGKYWAAYEEHARLPANDGTIATLFEMTYQGSWSTDGDRLIVAGLGVGTPSTHVGADQKVYPAIGFRLAPPLHDKRAAEFVFNVESVRTNEGPRGVSVNEYCGH